MFFDRLWVRVKGELLLLKDKLFEEGELREKAEQFLQNLERRLEGSDKRKDSTADFASRLDAIQQKMEKALAQARSASEKTALREKSETPTLEELERAWDELMRLRKEQGSQPPAEEPDNGTPRKLG